LNKGYINHSASPLNSEKANMKINCALIGSGNIGTDLMYKLLRSEVLNPVWMVGIDPDSEGLALARDKGLKTTHEGIDGMLAHIADDGVRIAFDATSAYVHAENSRKLIAQGVNVIDLTPAAIGPFCVPSVNLEEHIGKGEENVNMVTCGGQATIPMVHAVSRVQAVDYAEIVATIASKSAGPGTRKNIDEFTQTTARAIEAVGGATRGKAIIILNPAEPPMMMRDTVHCLTEADPDQEAIIASVARSEKEMQVQVPGFRVKEGPIFDGKRVSIFLEVTGRGDYLPAYAGNLDIMTAAACRSAEIFAGQMAPRAQEA
jgi:acetaldehyde/propanal dehydrogenase